MEATFAVALGNAWGHSFSALPHAKKIFASLRPEQWEYYMNECLRRDRTVLDKLAFDDKPLNRWIKLNADYEWYKLAFSDKKVREFIESCDSASTQKAKQQASVMRGSINS
jgi:hypothetical protein